MCGSEWYADSVRVVTYVLLVSSYSNGSQRKPKNRHVVPMVFSIE
jgi:hypothetical protein